MLACAAVLAGVIGLTGYRAWTMHTIDVARAAWQQSDEQRAALRYGDLRGPVDDKICRSLRFDNMTGAVGGEREVLCYVPPPPRSNRTVWNADPNAVTRVQAISEAFKH